MADLRAAIECRIAEVLAETDPRLGAVWRREAAAAHHLLPILTTWTMLIGLRPDGTIVALEDGADQVTPCAPQWARAALCNGARQYPELAALLPARPADALTCPGCGGSGTPPPPTIPEAQCICGGLGWTLPGEWATSDQP